jgi:tripartite-type tricarboxylate transporter receptor subunit TctC
MAHALLGGTIMAITESPAVAKASNLPILAAIPDERLAGLPEVPTMNELGFPALGFSAGGLIVPARAPDAALETLERACAKAVVSPGYTVVVERLGASPRYLPGAAVRKMFDQDLIESADAIKRAGLGNR